jgi:hypothetical protein
MSALDKEMKDWLLECFSDEYDQEQIEELTHNQLVRAINRYFDGGMKEFEVCCGWLRLRLNMTNETLIELFKAQDIVRRLWANATDSEIEKHLKLLDREMTKTINSIGKK